MAQFPCPLERAVASALLLLSSTPPLPQPSASIVSPPEKELWFSSEDDCWITDEGKGKSCSESSELSDSKSYSSSLTGEVSYDEIQALRTRIVAVVARRKEIKVVRKRRSKICWISGGQEITSCKVAMSSSGSASTETSCLSTSSSALSCGRSNSTAGPEMKLIMAHDERKRKRGGSTHMRRRAEAILRLLSGGCSSEVKIRQLLGDSPDTSKALRTLLKMEEVKRSGSGGRQDPYIYTIAGKTWESIPATTVLTHAECIK